MAAEALALAPPPLQAPDPRFVVSRSELLHALERLASIADTSLNPAQPAWGFVHAQIGVDDVTTLRATDGTTHYSIDVHAFGMRRGALCLPIRAMLAWLKRTTCRSLDLSQTSRHSTRPVTPNSRTMEECRECKITVRADARQTTLESFAPEDYPPKPAALSPGDRLATLQCGEFARAIASVLPAMSVDETRPHLAGVHVSSDDSLRLVATDGHRMHVVTMDGVPANAGPIPRGATYPSDAIRAVLAACQAGRGGECEIYTSGTGALTTVFGTDRITTRFNNDFPRWQEIIPTTFDLARPIDPREMLTEMRACAVVSGDRACGVELRIGPDWMVLRSENFDVGSAEMVLCDDARFTQALRTETPVVRVGVSARYLVAALKAAGDSATLHTREPLDPIMITAGDFQAVIMPIRL